MAILPQVITLEELQEAQKKLPPAHQFVPGSEYKVIVKSQNKINGITATSLNTLQPTTIIFECKCCSVASNRVKNIWVYTGAVIADNLNEVQSDPQPLRIKEVIDKLIALEEKYGDLKVVRLDFDDMNNNGMPSIIPISPGITILNDRVIRVIFD